MLVLGCLGVLACAGTPPENRGSLPDQAAALSALDSTFARLQQTLRLPGLTVAIGQGTRIVFARGYGLADVEAGTPVVPGTPFNIASLTKPMAATLLMQLVEHGQLDLNRPMRAYDPAFPFEASVMHVLSMTAESKPAGTGYAYNGSVFGTLRRVLETETRQSFRALLTARLIDSLALARTVPGLDAIDSATASGATARAAAWRTIVDQQATPYRLFGTELVRALPPPTDLSPAANVISTVLDYSRFVGTLMDGGLLGNATRERMWSVYRAPNGKALPYSHGWFVEEYGGVTLVWQHGYWPDAWSALVLVVPARGIHLIAMANADGLSSPFYMNEGVEGNALACAFLRALVDAGMPCREASATAVSRWQARPRPVPHRVVSVDPSEFEALLGRYRSTNGRVSEIEKTDNRLWWRTPRGQRFELFANADGDYFLKAADYTMRFIREAGRVTRIELRAGTTTTILTRL